MSDKKSSNRKITAGILGGMGPQATVELMQRVIDATPAVDDGDHIRMIVDNNPKVPSRIEALIDKSGDSPGPVLAQMASGLQSAGAGFLAMPCNTAHAYAADIRAAIDIPLLDMISLTVDEVASAKLPNARAGLLASPAVADLKLYEKPLAAHGIELFCPPSVQDELFEIIKAVKQGDSSAPLKDRFSAAAGQLAGAGADILIVACTELSVLTDALNSDPPVIDALDVLVRAILENAAT